MEATRGNILHMAGLTMEPVKLSCVKGGIVMMQIFHYGCKLVHLDGLILQCVSSIHYGTDRRQVSEKEAGLMWWLGSEQEPAGRRLTCASI